MNSPAAPLDFEAVFHESLRADYISGDESPRRQREKFHRIYDTFQQKVIERRACWMNSAPAAQFARWGRLLSQREFIVWEAIQDLGIPLWPRYELPVWGVLSFANPLAKVAVQCDRNVSQVLQWPDRTGLEALGWAFFWIRSEQFILPPAYTARAAANHYDETLEERIEKANQLMIQRVENLKTVPVADSWGTLTAYTWPHDTLASVRRN